ncbi:MAG: tripartite tricarboxylate transporter TctB family protein [Carbonactinosporaceae bacterium]
MRRPTSREVDLASGAGCTALGVFVLLQSVQLDLYVEGVPGPGFFPALLAIAMALSGALLVVSRVRAAGADGDECRLPTRRQATRSLSLWVAVLLAALLVDVVGFPVAMALLVATILVGIEGRRGIGTLVTIVAIPLGAWLLFALLLQVPLPSGVFGS